MAGKRVLVLSLVACCSLPSALAGACGSLVRDIDWRNQELGPYDETDAVNDFKPLTYLDGFYGDLNTKGTTNERVAVVKDGKNNALEVLFPEGCTTSECAMQAKSFLGRMESATMEMRLKFNANFDWVLGGKLPGLCGGTCPTGCKSVDGYDGFSARHMWRPCVWPPEHELNTINCNGGKLVSYVYHTEKEHWCGDDFEFENPLWARTYKTPKTPVVDKSFFQPQTGVWYTIWSHIEMNTQYGGDANGVLQTWIEGPGTGGQAQLVVDKQSMLWRAGDTADFGIDTLYFSTFYGGSSEKFQATRDEYIYFEYVKIWEGDCTPAGSGKKADTIDPPTSMPTPGAPAEKKVLDPTFKNSKLEIELLVGNMFRGGFCARFQVTNTGKKDCAAFEIVVGSDPSWVAIAFRRENGEPNVNALTLIGMQEEEGLYWFYADGVAGKVPAGETNTKTGACFATTTKIENPDAQYWIDQIDLMAKCVEPYKPKGVKERGSPSDPQPPLEQADPADPPISDGAPEEKQGAPASKKRKNKDAPPPEEDTSDPVPVETDAPQDAAIPLGVVFRSVRVYSSKTCVDMAVEYDGSTACLDMSITLNIDPALFTLDSKLTKAFKFDIVSSDSDTGDLELQTSTYGTQVNMGRRILKPDEVYNGRICVDYADSVTHEDVSVEDVETAFNNIQATCLRTS